METVYKYVLDAHSYYFARALDTPERIERLKL